MPPMYAFLLTGPVSVYLRQHGDGGNVSLCALCALAARGVSEPVCYVCDMSAIPLRRGRGVRCHGTVGRCTSHAPPHCVEVGCLDVLWPSELSHPWQVNLVDDFS